jgi:hypothetical protein
VTKVPNALKEALARHTGPVTVVPPKPKRGRGQRTLALRAAIFDIAEQCQPITGRGIGYKLFVLLLIASMSRADMQRVYTVLKEAREEGHVPWEWVVDETRALERGATWGGPADYARDVPEMYRRDPWDTQAARVEIWSEKGTIRGVLAPVLREYAVGFRVMHGFNSATSVHDIAEDDDGRPLIAFYVGDYDPSGLFMSEADLPNRLIEYGGHHVELRRIGLTKEDGAALPSFPAADKVKDPRYAWFTKNHGTKCWEIDALDPNTLRDRVEAAIKGEIDEAAWDACKTADRREREGLRSVIGSWVKNPIQKQSKPRPKMRRPKRKPLMASMPPRKRSPWWH